MLLTISCSGKDARDLSWLLHKRPDRFQSVDLAYGKAHVYFTEYSAGKCTACLLLAIKGDSLNELYKAKDGEFQYVNPRRYLSSSLLAAAMARVFSSALKGSCEDRPELPEREYDFSVSITNFSCRLDPAYIEKIFKPLGYAIDWKNLTANKFSTEKTAYGQLRLSAHCTLKAILAQLYILISVFDRHAHFWLGEEQVAKFIRHGEGWLETHPEKRRIINEYFWPAAELKHRIMEHFNALDRVESAPKLNTIRQERIAGLLSESGVKSVIDLGCGDGSLLALLQDQKKYSRLSGMDISPRNIEFARQKLAIHGFQNTENIFIGSLMYRDKRISGFDAAVLAEVIEHFELERMAIVMENILENGRPNLLIISTPNRTYNGEYATLAGGAMRHPDHRYEFDEGEFAAFIKSYADKYAYKASISHIGEERTASGWPTLLGILKKCA